MTREMLALQGSLVATGLVQPITTGGKTGTIEVLCRLVPGQEKPWLKLMDKVLEIAEQSNIDVHLCKQFLRKDGQMVAGWFIGIRTKSIKGLKKAIETLAPAFEAAKPILSPVGQEVVVQRQQAPTTQQVVTQRAPVAPVPYKPPSYANQTEARPRPPDLSGPDPVRPDNAPPHAIRVVKSERDEKGRQIVETVMPLPHIYADRNRPNQKGRGAWAGSSFAAPRRS